MQASFRSEPPRAHEARKKGGEGSRLAGHEARAAAEAAEKEAQAAAEGLRAAEAEACAAEEALRALRAEGLGQDSAPLPDSAIALAARAVDENIVVLVAGGDASYDEMGAVGPGKREAAPAGTAKAKTGCSA